jgi:2'-5' RNA ligase
MFWVEGEKNRNLAILQYGLEKELLGVQPEKEIREFKPHITLGRIKTFEWRQLKKRPNIEENINLVCPVNSIEIMESQLKPGGPDYFILESINLE